MQTATNESVGKSSDEDCRPPASNIWAPTSVRRTLRQTGRV